MKVWKGETPQHTIAVKLDGIQAMLDDKGRVVARSGKALYNIDPKHLKPGRKYEVYCGSFKETQSIVRASKSKRRAVRKDELFEIWPKTDKRIVLSFADASKDLTATFLSALSHGFEGLVIDQTYKLKRAETHDVIVTAVLPGKGKHAGRMGALMTTKGKVGTGFTDKDRDEDWKPGDVIEVECMELTAAGKMRKPRFIRRRWDKPASEIEE